MHGLLMASEVRDGNRHFSFVHFLFTSWISTHPKLEYKDHAIPGVPLVLLYQKTNDAKFLATSQRLGGLYTMFSRSDEGISFHRPDLERWSSYIWVDCIHLDAPNMYWETSTTAMF